MLVALLAALMLLLTACDWNMSATFHENNTADFRSELKVSKEESETLRGPGAGFDCQELLRLQDQHKTSQLTVEDQSQDGNIHCVSSGEGVPIEELFDGDISVQNHEGTYTVRAEPDKGMNPADLEKLDLKFNPTMTFTFPGRVIEATAGSVNGNTVELKGLDTFREGFTIKAESKAPAGFGLGTGVWIALLVGALVVIGVVVALLARRRKTHQPVQSQPYSQGQPHPGQTPPPRN